MKKKTIFLDKIFVI